MDVDRQNLQAENLLLGAMVQDLQARCARDDGPSQPPPPAPAPAPPPAPVPPPPAAPLRMTEDALLDMHQECKVARQALRRQTDVLQRTQALLSDAKRTNAQQKQALTAEASGSGSNSNLPTLDPRSSPNPDPNPSPNLNPRRAVAARPSDPWCSRSRR